MLFPGTSKDDGKLLRGNFVRRPDKCVGDNESDRDPTIGGKEAGKNTGRGDVLLLLILIIL
jgi:hypothetical protein